MIQSESSSFSISKTYHRLAGYQKYIQRLEFANTGKSPEACRMEPNRRRRALEAAALQDMMIQTMTSSVAIFQSHDRCCNLMGTEFDIQIVVVKAAFHDFSLFSWRRNHVETIKLCSSCRIVSMSIPRQLLVCPRPHYIFLTISHQIETNRPLVTGNDYPTLVGIESITTSLIVGEISPKVWSSLHPSSP